MKNDFLVAITQISAERHLPKETVLEAVEQALVLGYKRNFGAAQNIDVRIDPNTGNARVYVEKEVVEEIKDERTQIPLQEARKIEPLATVGTFVRIETTPKNFGRIAAQTAKQVILQRIREAERDSMYADWSDRLGELVLGTIRNIDSSGNIVLSLGRAEAVMPKSEQIPTEQYQAGQKLRTYICEVEKSSRGPRILVSRTHRKLLRRLLESEVPEVFNGTVEIKAIAREPGSRSKVAVSATQPGVDPVGSCVGMRGVRIQSIVNEMNGEKIDVVAWAADEKVFIANALSPAKVERVWLDPQSKTATVVVPDTQLSLAIGKLGQNARLAAKLTNWRIDIKSTTEAAGEAARRAKEEAEAAAREAELAAKRAAAKALLAEAELALAQEEAAVAEPQAAPVAEAAGEATAPATTAPTPEAAAPVPEPTPVTQATPAVAEAAEAAAPGAEPAATAEQAYTWQPEAEEEGELDEAGGKRKGDKKKRGQEDLVFDEKAGKLVRRPQRKESRQQDWRDQVEEE